MILKIKKQFRDKYTQELYKVDDTIEVSEERGAELLADSRELVEAVEEKEEKKKKRKK